MSANLTPRGMMEFAVDAAWQAGKITLEYFQTPIPTDLKSDLSPVTIADRRAERALRELIERAYPGHAILGEEEGETGPPDARYRWIVDPIDGTQSFIRGVPIYGVMIAVEVDGEPVAGVVNMPALGEIVYAARGEGCFWNGRRARVSEVATLDASLVLATDLATMAAFGRKEAYDRLAVATKMQRTWGDCYGHLLVATGRAEVMLDPIMSLWDSAALAPIVTEAGGTLTDWTGRPTHAAPEALSTNGKVFDEVVRTIAGTAPDA